MSTPTKPPLELTGQEIICYVERPCPHCAGAGETFDNHCTSCGARFTQEETDAFWQQIGDARTAEMTRVALPCGHNYHSFADFDQCVECEGTGRIRVPVTLDDIAAWLRQDGR